MNYNVVGVLASLALVSIESAPISDTPPPAHLSRDLSDASNSVHAAADSRQITVQQTTLASAVLYNAQQMSSEFIGSPAVCASI